MEIAKLIARYEADTSDFEKGAQRVGNALDKVVKQSGKQSSVFSQNIKNISASWSSFVGNLGANLISKAIDVTAQLGKESIKLYGSFDKLVRFTATLDKAFQSNEGLQKLKNDIQQLSTEIPQSADDIAKASFSIKSAFSSLTETDLISYLREFGIAATASNTDIAAHAERVAALAKAYGITAKDLRGFSAMIASSFGQALASDANVSEGFNRLITTAKLAKVPLNDLIAAMSTIQSTSSDAEQNTTNLQNAIQKLGDSKYIENLKEVFNIDRFTKDGGIKTLNELINELAKSLDGLPDATKMQKINAVFKDQQANQGIAALIENVKAYNKQLQDGSDENAFVAKHKIMLNSAEAQWTLFWAKIENGQREAGGRMARAFNDIFNQTTMGASLGGLFSTLGSNLSAGLYGLIEIVALAAQDAIGAGASFLNSLLGFMDQSELEVSIAKDRESISNYWSRLQIVNENALTKWEESSKESQKKHWENILVSPLADENLKAKSKASLESLNASIQQSFSSMAESNFVNWKKIGEVAVAGLKSADPAIQNQAKLTIANLKQILVSASEDSKYSTEMRQQFSKLWSSLPTISLFEINAAKPQINNALNNLVQVDPAKATKTGLLLGDSFINSLSNSVQSGKGQVQQSQNSLFANQNTSVVTSSGFRIGTNLWQGIVQGINSGRGEVKAAGSALGFAAESGTRTQLQTQSPSKVFYAIGKDVVQGFIDGIRALRLSAQSAMASILDVSHLKVKTTKKDTAAIEYLTSLINEIARFNVTTKEQEAILSLATKALSKANVEYKKAILDGAKYLDNLNATKEATSTFLDLIKDLTGDIVISKLSQLNNLLGDSKITEAIKARAAAMKFSVEQFKAWMRLQAGLADEEKNPIIAPTGERVNSGQGPNSQIEDSIAPVFHLPQAAANKGIWGTIFDSFKQGITNLQTSLPGLKQSLSDIFIDLPNQAGSAISNALGNWDHSFRGFFVSIGKGFADLITQLINELIRMLVVKMIMQLVGSMFGGGGGQGLGSLGMSDFKGVASGLGGMSFAAEGGFFKAGQPVVVGERGWEMFIPSTSGTVVNQDQLKGMGGKKVINNININASRSDSLATPKSRRQTAEAMTSALRRYNK